jgi:LysM repeat protein
LLPLENAALPLLGNQFFMKQYFYIFIILFSSSPFFGCAQNALAERTKKYIADYCQLAIAEQKRTGIPASVTLAQGVVETDAGTSVLMTKANNHFGMKCKKDWTGPTFIHSDDLPNECFKKYGTAYESYKDHSDHLKNNARYAPLFQLSVTDYAGWALGLKKYGYATNSAYSIKLIKTIEDYHLQEYTYAAVTDSDAKYYPKSAIAIAPQTKVADEDDDTVETTNTAQKDFAEVPPKKRDTEFAVVNFPKPHTDTPKFALLAAPKKADTPVVAKRTTESPKAADLPQPKRFIIPKKDSGKQIELNGLNAFYAYEGEMLLKYAVKYNVHYAHLLEWNDLKDAPLPFNMPVYLEKKNSIGKKEHHTVAEGETMLFIAQTEGIQLRKLFILNKMAIDEEPDAGAVLSLQKPADVKPNVHTAQEKRTEKKNITQKIVMKPAESDYLNTDHRAKSKPDKTPAADTSKIKVADRNADKHKPALQGDTTKEDLTGLKEELDRVVYADNPKSKSKKETTKDAAPTQDTVQMTVNKPERTPSKAEPPQKTAKNQPKKPGKKKPTMYTVKHGETLGGIAIRHDVSVKDLQRWNHIKGVNIREGKQIRVSE